MNYMCYLIPFILAVISLGLLSPDSEAFSRISNNMQYIPGAVWGAFVGSFMTLIGVIVTLRDGRKRFITQLHHETIQRKQERELSIKRDIFIEAAEAIAEAQERFSKLLTMNLDDVGQLYSNSKLLRATNKIHLIASEKTIEAFTRYSEEYLKSTVKMMLPRGHLDYLGKDVASIEYKINQNTSSRTELIQLLSVIKDQSEKKDQISEVAIKIKNIDSELEKLNSLRLEKLKSQFTAQCELSNMILHEATSLGEILVDLSISARNELDLQIDESYYRKLIKSRQDNVKQYVDEYMNRFKNIMSRLE